MQVAGSMVGTHFVHIGTASSSKRKLCPSGPFNLAGLKIRISLELLNFVRDPLIFSH